MMVETTLDNLLEGMEVSYFHYRLMVICGLAFMADAMEVSLLGFLSTCAGHEWGLTDSQQASITGVVFAGEIAGSLFWGPIADTFGRKIAFLITCVLISAGMCSSDV
jgi:MFS family permease